MNNKIKPVLNECTICFNIMTSENSIKLKCSHFFHKNCIFKWFEKGEDINKHYSKYHNILIKGSCPLCRKKQTQIIYGKYEKCIIS